MSFIKGKYIQSKVGHAGSRILIEGLHVIAPRNELGVNEIVNSLNSNLDCNCILALQSREQIDLNCPPVNSDEINAHNEYRSAIFSQLSNLKLLNKDNLLIRPFLALSLHGMKDSYGFDIAIGTHHGASVSSEVREWLINEIKNSNDSFVLDIDGEFEGWESITYHRSGDGKEYKGYGENFNYIQLEFSRRLRTENPMKVIEIITRIANEFQTKF